MTMTMCTVRAILGYCRVYRGLDTWIIGMDSQGVFEVLNIL